MQIEAYFDESATHAGSKVMAMAGYLFRNEESEQMANELLAYLASKDLPYFHMVDCAHGNPPFDKLSPKERILVEARLIGLIKKYTVQAIGVTIDLESFRRRFGEKSFMGTSYSLAFYMITRGLARWAEETAYAGEIAYFFEAGHASQREANEMMRIALLVPEIKANMRYGRHAFVDKAKTPQVQAADLLAWLLTKDRKGQNEGRPRRKDYESLMDHPSYIRHISDKEFAVLEPLWNRQRQQLIELVEKRDLHIKRHRVVRREE